MYIWLDIESFLTRPGLLIPPMVSLAWMSSDTHYRKVEKPRLLHAEADRRRLEYKLEKWLKDDNIMIWGHRLAYDMAIICRWCPRLTYLVFKKYLKMLIRDIRIRCRLLDIRRGTLDFAEKGIGPGLAEANKLYGEGRSYPITKYSMEGMALRFVPGYEPHKNDWQLRYGELINTKINDWPKAAKKYAKDDPYYTYRIGAALPVEENHEGEECRSAFALHLSAAHGIRVDYDLLMQRKEQYTQQREENAEFLCDLGLLKIKSNGDYGVIKKEVQSYVEEGFLSIHGESAPLTDPSKTFPKGQTKTAVGVLAQLGGYKGIKELIAYNQATKMLSTFVPPLEAAGEAGRPVTPRIEPLVNSGRPSCADPNLYNPPKVGGIRGTIIPSDGNVVIASDYSGNELHSFSQTCIDWGIHSTMAEIINEGGDVHCRMTAELLGMPYKRVFKLYKLYNKLKEESGRMNPRAEKVAHTRSPLAKAAVFGGLGGLGAMKFVEFCWAWNLFISKNKAYQVLATLKRAFPETKLYFEVIKELCKVGQIIIPRSNFTRGLKRNPRKFTIAANTHFQSPSAHGAKDALFYITMEAHCDSTSPLYDTRTMLFLYDEILQDTPKEQAEEAMPRIKEWMEFAMDKYVPDVPSKVDGEIMPRWRDK